MRTGHAGLVVLALVFHLPGQARPPAPVKEKPTPIAPRDGECTAAGRWYVEGGSAARNGWSAAAPLLRRPRLAWTQKVSGTIVGEPLVWDEHLVLAVRINDKKRAIEVRRLADGKLVGSPRVMESTADPSPSLWGNEILWRPGPDGLETLRINARSVDFLARTPTTKGMGAPLHLGTKLWTVVAGQIVCMRVADFRVLWRSQASGFSGSLSLLDNHVFALQRVGDDYALAALDRDTGTVASTSGAVPLTKNPGDETRVQLAGNRGIVRFGGAQSAQVKMLGGIVVNALQVELPLRDGVPGLLEIPTAHGLDHTRQLGAVVNTKATALMAIAPDGKTGLRLDTCDLHRRIAAAPPTMVAGAVYLGATAIDTGEFRMLWRLEKVDGRELPITRAIPTRNGILLASSDEIFVFRADVPEDPIGAELDTAWLAAQEAKVRPLVDDAAAAADWDLADELLARARGFGADEAWATRKEKDLVVRSKDSRRKPDEAKAKAVRVAADGIASVTLDDLHGTIAGWTSRAPEAIRRGLRWLLARAPAHGAAGASVRAMLPKEMPIAEPFLPADWLDFLDATSRTKVTFFDAKAEDFGKSDLDPITAQNQQQLLEWRHRWRPDLQALLGGRTLLFTPVSRPGSIAKAIATGETVCDTLEAMFADVPRVREDPRPMLVFLYPDRDEYIAESKKIGVDIAEWAAGYYGSALNEVVPKSRLYVPADDAGFASVLPTLAHELTHHWLMDRCPAFRPDAAAVMAGPKAFWIVEGFASLIGQFDFDLVNRRAALGKGDLEDADIVASASPRQLISWERLCRMSHLDFARMSQATSESTIASTMHLGAGYHARRLSLFYAQSAMLARYLYETEGGRHRRALLDYVVAYYTGALDKLDFKTAFGLDPKEIGPKIVEFSKQLTQ
ncbi:MAG: hypothetical protein JNK78_11110 [Planctomycetes bacterium]|nr:hypothetical protein [Planctomycetota bacterium]